MSWIDECNDAEVGTGVKKNFLPLQTGKYPVEVNKALIDDSGEKAFIDWEFQVIDGEHQGRRIWTRSYLTTKAYPIIRNIIVDAGFVLDRAEELQGVLEKLAEKNWIMDLKVSPNPNKPEYPYLNLNGLEEYVDILDGAVADDDLPF